MLLPEMLPDLGNLQDSGRGHFRRLLCLLHPGDARFRCPLGPFQLPADSDPLYFNTIWPAQRPAPHFQPLPRNGDGSRQEGLRTRLFSLAETAQQLAVKKKPMHSQRPLRALRGKKVLIERGSVSAGSA